MRADAELDLARLAELQRHLDTPLADIVATLVGEIERALAAMDAALGDGDLNEVARQAHAARNSALMVDARPLLDALAALEAGARAEEPAACAEARTRAGAGWVGLRARLQDAARDAG